MIGHRFGNADFVRDVADEGEILFVGFGGGGGSSGSSRSLLASSSMFTSLNVTTRTFFTKRAGRYMSQTHASRMATSKKTSPLSELRTLSSTSLVR